MIPCPAIVISPPETIRALSSMTAITGLPITSAELYERLKLRQVLVIPGHHFFFGCETQDWPHSRECIRVSFAMDEQTVRDGLKIIAEVVESAFRKG